jgi:hypothetical protein
MPFRSAETVTYCVTVSAELLRFQRSGKIAGRSDLGIFFLSVAAAPEKKRRSGMGAVSPALYFTLEK